MNKRIKCLISLMLVFSMIFSTMVFSVSAALTVEDIVNKEDPQFDIVHLMVKLGIFKEGDKFPASLSESITRAEFVEYAMRLNKYNELDVSGVTPPRYTDIDESHPYYKTITLAAALNVLTYDEYDLTFKPDDYITFDEGLAVVINALGYKEYAMHTGEYPSSYRVLATQLGLYDSLDSSNNDGIMTYDTACQLIFNGFTAPIFEVSSVSELTGEVFWKMNENKTVLSEKHNIFEVEGILSANDSASLIPGKYAERGTAVIKDNKTGNEVRYYNANADEAVYEYLGYNVRAFYLDNKDTGKKELIYVGLIDKKNDVFTLKNEDIASVVKNAGSIVITYFDENENVDTITIDASTKVLFNGKAYNSSEIYKEWFHGDTANKAGLLNNGEIVFIDNGGSADYDVAFIYEYNTTIVDNVNVEDRYIYDAEDATYNIDLDYSEKQMYYSITDADNKKLEIKDLKKGDVLLVAESADKRVVKIKVARDSKSVIISAKDAADKLLTIGTKDYDAGERIDMTNIVLGEQVIAYFDVLGNVAWIEKSAASSNGNLLGYLITMGLSGRSSLSRDVDVSIVTSGKEERVTYRLAESLTVDGERIKSTYSMFKSGDPALYPAFFTAQDVVNQQLISFKLNADGEISEIDTGILGAEEDPDETLCKAFVSTASGVFFKGNNIIDWTDGQKYVIKFITNNNIPVFYTPSVATDFDEFSSAMDLSRHLMTSSSQVTNFKPTVYTYGVNSVVPCGIAVQGAAVTSAGAIDEYAIPYYFDKVMYTVYTDEDGEDAVGYTLNLVDTDGKAKSVVLPDKYNNFSSATTSASVTLGNDAPTAGTALTIKQVADALGAGDIICIAEDDDGYLNNIQWHYDYSSDLIYRSSSGSVNVSSVNGERTYVLGLVYHRDNTHYTITPNYSVLTDADPSNDGTALKNAVNMSDGKSINIFKVENGKLTFRKATKKDLLDFNTYGTEATRAFVNYRYDSCQKKLFFERVSGAGTVDPGFGKYPAYFVKSESDATVVVTKNADAGVTFSIPDADAAFKNSKPGFKFMGWNDGNASYKVGDTYTMPEATVIFYPIWENGYTTTFVSGAQTPSTGEAPASGYYAQDETFIVPANTWSVTGFAFNGWSDGTNIYQPGVVYTMPSSDVTFTAQWIPAYNYSFVGGTGATGTAPATGGAVEGATITLPENTFVKIDATGKYDFEGWNDGVTTYPAGVDYIMPANDVTFTAQWSALPSALALTLTRETKTEYLTAPLSGGEVTLPSDCDVTGVKLAGWTEDNGTTILAPGSTYTLSVNATLKGVYYKEMEFIDWYLKRFDLYDKDGDTNDVRETDDGGKVFNKKSDRFPRHNDVSVAENRKDGVIYTTLDLSDFNKQILKATWYFDSARPKQGSNELRAYEVTAGDYATVFEGIAEGESSASSVDVSALELGAAEFASTAGTTISSASSFGVREYTLTGMDTFITNKIDNNNTSVKVAFKATCISTAKDIADNFHFKYDETNKSYIRAYYLADAAPINTPWNINLVTGAGASSPVVPIGESYTLPEANDKTGWTFAGWTTDGGANTIAAGTAIDEATANGKVYKAMYTKNINWTSSYLFKADGYSSSNTDNELTTGKAYMNPDATLSTDISWMIARRTMYNSYYGEIDLTGVTGLISANLYITPGHARNSAVSFKVGSVTATEYAKLDSVTAASGQTFDATNLPAYSELDSYAASTHNNGTDAGKAAWEPNITSYISSQIADGKAYLRVYTYSGSKRTETWRIEDFHNTAYVTVKVLAQ